MVVDDEHELTKVLKTVLEDEGFAADTFNDPKDALSKYEPGRYGLVILDIRMPKMNGFELFRELKKKDAEVKVCFLTGFEMYSDEFKRLFPDIRVQGFLKKPVSISSLAPKIKEMMA